MPIETVTGLGLSHPDYPQDTIVIIASHDCDVAQNPDNEPNVELIIGRRISNVDGNNTHAKNPRILHLSLREGEPIYAEFFATAKRNIPKSSLMPYQDNRGPALSPESHSTFQRWLAARYRRSAFPDEFDRRIKANKFAEKITKVIKPHGETIVGLFFDVDNGDDLPKQGTDDVYLLDISIVYTVKADFGKAEAAAITVRQKIEKAFKDNFYDKATGVWSNIELRYCEEISEEALSYRQFSLLKQWRLDYISLAAVPHQPLAAD